MCLGDQADALRRVKCEELLLWSTCSMMGGLCYVSRHRSRNRAWGKTRAMRHQGETSEFWDHPEWPRACMVRLVASRLIICQPICYLASHFCRNQREGEFVTNTPNDYNCWRLSEATSGSPIIGFAADEQSEPICGQTPEHCANRRRLRLGQPSGWTWPDHDFLLAAHCRSRGRERERIEGVRLWTWVVSCGWIWFWQIKFKSPPLGLLLLLFSARVMHTK